jgi:toxin CcdB
MAKFDVHVTRDTGALVVDCQSDLIDYFDTRFVVPLVPPKDSSGVIPRLTPTFSIDGEKMVMATQFAGSVPKQVLGPAVASLAAHDFAISAALDMLISGY